MLESLNSTSIMEIAQNKGIYEILQVTLNSVLVPSTSNNFQEYKIKFAHKSYQEFFTAFKLFNLIESQTLTDIYNVTYNDNIVNFFFKLIENEELKFKSLIQQYKHLSIFKKAKRHLTK